MEQPESAMEGVEMKFEWHDKNVLVTGASGILGSWLVKGLLSKKANVIGLIRDQVPLSELALSGNINKISIVHGKLEDYSLIERAINEYEIDTVFHLGAQAIVKTAERFPISTFESNIKGTWNILEACRNNQTVRRVVVASSDKAYGNSDKLPYTEDMPVAGENPYDASKSCCDILSQSYAKTYGLPITIARCGNIYGGGDLNFNRIVPETIKAALHDENPIIRSDGTYIRDYLYVMDAVDAYMTLAEKTEEKSVKGQAFNFGTTKPTRVLDVVKMILEISGKRKLKPIVKNTAKAEIREQYLDCSKARKILKWAYRYELNAGLMETFKWYQGFFKRQKPSG